MIIVVVYKNWKFYSLFLIYLVYNEIICKSIMSNIEVL